MSTPRYALCLFQPDPPRGPVPSCRIVAEATRRSSLEPLRQAIHDLLGSPFIALSSSSTDHTSRVPLKVGDVSILVVPLVLGRSALAASEKARALAFADWQRTNGIAP